jgi:hypothetical protein
MNSLKDYIKLYSKFKTDAELARDTGLSKQEVRFIKRQLNIEALNLKIGHDPAVLSSRASKNSRPGAKATPRTLSPSSKVSTLLPLSFLSHRK